MRTGEGQRTGRRKEAIAETLVAWQRRWNDLGDKAQWPKRMIPNISAWMAKKFGYFQAYLHKYKIVVDGRCKFCEEASDTAKHTLFCCPRWAAARKDAAEALRSPVAPENFARLMLRDEESWNVLSTLVNHIMKDKLDEERRAQAQEPDG